MTTTSDQILDLSWQQWVLRTLWIVIRLALAIALAKRGSYFFYQGF